MKTPREVLTEALLKSSSSEADKVVTAQLVALQDAGFRILDSEQCDKLTLVQCIDIMRYLIEKKT